jgi:hypothetical protein
MTTTQTSSFQVGKSYFSRCACDYNRIFEMVVVSRTAKTLKTSDGKKLRIRTPGAIEIVEGFDACDDVRPPTEDR